MTSVCFHKFPFSILSISFEINSLILKLTKNWNSTRQPKIISHNTRCSKIYVFRIKRCRISFYSHCTYIQIDSADKKKKKVANWCTCPDLSSEHHKHTDRYFFKLHFSGILLYWIFPSAFKSSANNKKKKKNPPTSLLGLLYINIFSLLSFFSLSLSFFSSGSCN